MDHADLQIRRPKIFFRELTQGLPVTFIGGRTEHAAGDFCLHPLKIKRGNDLFRRNARDIPIMQNQMDEELYILFRNIPAAQNSRCLLLIMQEQVFPGSKRHGLVGTAVGCAGWRRTDDVVSMIACPERIALKEAFPPGAEKTTTFSGKSCGIMDMLQQGITPDDVRAAVCSPRVRRQLIPGSGESASSGKAGLTAQTCSAPRQSMPCAIWKDVSAPISSTVLPLSGVRLWSSSRSARA